LQVPGGFKPLIQTIGGTVTSAYFHYIHLQEGRDQPMFSDFLYAQVGANIDGSKVGRPSCSIQPAPYFRLANAYGANRQKAHPRWKQP
jgi:hypothetical protein